MRVSAGNFLNKICAFRLIGSELYQIILQMLNSAFIFDNFTTKKTTFEVHRIVYGHVHIATQTVETTL